MISMFLWVWILESSKTLEDCSEYVTFMLEMRLLVPEDLIRQIKECIYSLKCSAGDIEIENKRAFIKDDINQCGIQGYSSRFQI